MSVVTNDQIIDAYITWKTREGWAVNYRDANGTQLTIRKQWSKLGIYTGLFALPLWGVGLIFWALTILDYLLAKDKTMYVSVGQMETQLKARRG